MRLGAGDWRAEILPEHGAAFARLDFAGRPVLAPLPEGADPNATRAGAFWMLPWTNRLDGGRFPWRGAHRFPLNKPEEGNAIHGLGRDHPWAVEWQGAAEAVLTQCLASAPFHYEARLALRVDAAGFHLDLLLRNTGSEPCPMGFGWHPWFARPEGSHVRFTTTTRLRRGARNLPDAALPDRGLDAADSVFIGADDHYAGWDGEARLVRPDLALELTASGDWAANLQFHAPEIAPVLCLEPVSHVPDVINRPDLARCGAMRVLAPGQALHGAVTLKARAAA